MLAMFSKVIDRETRKSELLCSLLCCAESNCERVIASLQLVQCSLQLVEFESLVCFVCVCVSVEGTHSQ